MFIKSAGITIVTKSIENSAGNPTIYCADNKKVVPLINVPNGKLIITNKFCLILLLIFTKPSLDGVKINS